MRKTINQVFGKYLKRQERWDDICSLCGQCCYTRVISGFGKVMIDKTSPCEFYNEENHLCTVFENRFHKCLCCSRVTFFQALFNPTMPPDCAYVITFRIWRKK